MPSCYQFYFADLDTLVLVESSPDEVIIRATRHTFSERRKDTFIHALAAEGFIPESYAWASAGGPHGLGGIRWLVDLGWLKDTLPDPGHSRRFMWKLLGGATLLWILLMSGLLATAGGWGWLSPGPSPKSTLVSRLPCPTSGPTQTNCWPR
jgi:hypothetical protein